MEANAVLCEVAPALGVAPARDQGEVGAVGTQMNTSKILIIVALGCFALAAFGVNFVHVALVPLGLAFFMGSKLA
jgi:hypothetical protein